MRLLLFMILAIDVLNGKVITCGDAMIAKGYNRLYLHDIAQQRAQREIEDFMGKKILTPYPSPIVGKNGTLKSMAALIETFWCEAPTTPLHSAYYNFYSRNKSAFENDKLSTIKKETKNITKQQDMIAYNKDKSGYFKRHQKYVCVNRGSYIGDDFIPNNDIKQVMKYPTRFYVNNNNVLYTDRGLKLNFQSIDKGTSIYSDKKTYYFLTVDNKKNKILLVGGSNQNYKGKAIIMMYRCTWTDNWTIGR